MGCHSSKPEERSELRPIAVSGPIGGPVQVPPPYRDQDGRPIQHQSCDLDSTTLLGAFDDMASFLKDRGQRVRIVAVGGAVNTLYLRSRPSTHDVDFFLENANSPLHNILHEAARSVNRSRRGRLGADWFNNAVQIFMARQLQQQLFNDALQQNVRIYDQAGLIVYAAPWSYALCGKLNRLCDSNPRSYDIDDAVIYLHEHLRSTGRTVVAASEIESWCAGFGKNVRRDVLQRLDRAYQRRYRREAIDLNG